VREDLVASLARQIAAHQRGRDPEDPRVREGVDYTLQRVRKLMQRFAEEPPPPWPRASVTEPLSDAEAEAIAAAVITRLADCLAAVRGARFPVIALTRESWSNRGYVASHDPAGDASARGRPAAVEAVTLAWGVQAAGAEWIRLRSAARLAPADELAREALGLGLGAVGGARESDGAARVTEDALPRSITLRLDGAPLDLVAVQAGGVLAASALLSESSVTISGSFDPEAIELETVTDIAHQFAPEPS
jgi:hypothetical protein